MACVSVNRSFMRQMRHFRSLNTTCSLLFSRSYSRNIAIKQVNSLKTNLFQNHVQNQQNDVNFNLNEEKQVVNALKTLNYDLFEPLDRINATKVTFLRKFLHKFFFSCF